MKHLSGHVAVTIGIAVSLIAPMSAHAAAVVNPADSFVQNSATTPAEIIKQVSGNAQAQVHYAKILGVSRTQVVSYLKSNLKLTHLKSAGQYTVYCVRTNGYIYPTMQYVPAGSTVFGLRDGKRMMMQVGTGNPLIGYMPAVHETFVPVIKQTTKVAPSVETLEPTQPIVEVQTGTVSVPVYQTNSPVTQAPANVASQPSTTAAGASAPADGQSASTGG